MTKYTLWAEGWRAVEDSCEIEAFNEDEAVRVYCEKLWFEDGTINRSLWANKPMNIFCQAAGDDSARLYCVSVNIEPSFIVEEV